MGRALAESALEFESSNYGMVSAKESLVKEMEPYFTWFVFSLETNQPLKENDTSKDLFKRYFLTCRLLSCGYRTPSFESSVVLHHFGLNLWPYVSQNRVRYKRPQDSLFQTRVVVGLRT
ncbi:hypothetical protein GOBAR_AA21497 [Gossypium barbadense]|uniref:Uncharacterized protein n=1 Tax=Gossypium barbadense TaxID=3634 RepID=A0A2P5X760_GOSBA|nr:hypothetical protein GOBAR_AA21497 [Gossypium barbadense]